MSIDERIAKRLELLNDTGWRAALTIFSGDLLADNGLVWAWIDLDRRTIYIEDLLWEYGVLSGGEQRMVRLALSLFNQDLEVNLYRNLAGLDEDNEQLAAAAVLAFIQRPVELRADIRMAIVKALQEKPVRKPRQSTRPVEAQR
jgi:hypothetical protein